MQSARISGSTLYQFIQLNSMLHWWTKYTRARAPRRCASSYTSFAALCLPRRYRERPTCFRFAMLLGFMQVATWKSCRDCWISPAQGTHHFQILMQSLPHVCNQHCIDCVIVEFWIVFTLPSTVAVTATSRTFGYIKSIRRDSSNKWCRCWETRYALNLRKHFYRNPFVLRKRSHPRSPHCSCITFH